MLKKITLAPPTADYVLPPAAEKHRGRSTTQAHAMTVALVGMLLVTLAFAINYWIAIRLYDLRVLDQADVWFETDGNWYIQMFSIGPRWFNYRHANIAIFVHFPVKNIAKALTALGLSSLPAEQLHIRLALLVVPVVTAFRTLVLFSFFRRVLGVISLAAVVCVIDIFAFSNLITGSIPESFPLSAACIAVMYWLVAHDFSHRPRLRAAAWVAIATVSIGITLTNVIPLVVLMGFAYCRRGVTLRNVATMAAIGATATLLNAGVALDVSRRYSIHFDPHEALEKKEGYRPATAGITPEFAWSVAHTILAPRPSAVANVAEKTVNPTHYFAFTYSPPHPRRWADLWRALVTVGLLAAGVLGFRRARAPLWLLGAPAVILALNYAVHLVYGDHFFVYSQHWASSLLIVISGVAFLARERPALRPVLPAFAILVAVNSLYQLSWLFARLQASYTLSRAG